MSFLFCLILLCSGLEVFVAAWLKPLTLGCESAGSGRIRVRVFPECPALCHYRTVPIANEHDDDVRKRLLGACNWFLRWMVPACESVDIGIALKIELKRQGLFFNQESGRVERVSYGGT